MTPSKHTPGSWILSGASTEIRSNKGELIATTNHHLELRSESQKKANARLIAAAPDLLEALEEALMDLEQFKEADDSEITEESSEHPIVRKCRAAIAKAKGE